MLSLREAAAEATHMFPGGRQLARLKRGALAREESEGGGYEFCRDLSRVLVDWVEVRLEMAWHVRLASLNNEE